MEEWRNIDGFDYYQVSNEGRVRSVDHEVEHRISGGVITSRTIKGKVLKPAENIWGYLYVNLYKEGKVRNKTVHRLVAESFLPNENSLPDVNHKNEDKNDNRVENLEWCTREYNVNYGTRNQRSAKALTNHPKRSKPVAQYTLDGTLVKVWPSANEAGRNGFKQGAVSNCCNGKLKTHKGYKWQYIN